MQDTVHDGLILTLGTDTLEEAAYLLDLTIEVSKPLVITGSMKNNSMPDNDIQENLSGAIRVAIDQDIMPYGVVVVMNRTIISAQNAVKTHSLAVSAFQSSLKEEVGIINEENKVVYLKSPVQTMKIKTDDLKLNKNVELFKMSLLDSCQLLSLAARKIIRFDGLVIEGYGGGHLPPLSLSDVEKIIKQQVPVVICSRIGHVPMLKDTYTVPGGEIELRKMGVYFSDMDGLKTRMKLMVALECGKAELGKYFTF